MSSFVIATSMITGGLLGGGVAFIYYATYAVRSQLLGRTDWRGRSAAGSVALTFDDGPSEETDSVLDVLATNGIRATFFMIGRNVERFPKTVRRVITEGHEIGNHSYSHPIFLYQTPRETREQLERAQRVLKETAGIAPRLARPPCGVRTPAYFKSAQRLGLRTVQWDVSGFDWKKRTGEEIAREVLRRASAGSIILLHDGDSDGKEHRLQTVAALPIIIEGLKRKGLSIEPLSQLLADESLAA